MHNLRGIGWSGSARAMAVCSLLLCGSSFSFGSATLGLNTTTVQNAAGQQLLLTINGTDTNVQGADLYVQINDGGTGNGGTSTKPTITTISMSQSGMMFAGDGGLETFHQTNGPLIADDHIASPTQLSDASKTLAAITLDASALSPGNTFTIQFFNVGPSHNTTDLSDNLGSTTSITLSGTGFSSPATITVVPEPACALMLALGAGLVLTRRRQCGK